jgi:hypothetical protein
MGKPSSVYEWQNGHITNAQSYQKRDTKLALKEVRESAMSLIKRKTDTCGQCLPSSAASALIAKRNGMLNT